MSNQYDIFVSTLNCGKLLPFGQPSELEKVLELLLPADKDHDIYALGFQELVAIWEGSFPQLVESNLKLVSDICYKCLQKRQGNRNYELVSSHNSGALGVVIFADKKFKFSNIFKASVRCGLFYSSLKGAAAIKFTVTNEESTLTDTFIFIDAHLAANEGEVNRLRRIADWGTIFGRVQQEFGHFEGNHVFFLGDLNFRISNWKGTDTNYTSNEAIKELLAKYDELSLSIQSGSILSGFEEAEINFPPTYKFLLTTPQEQYDLRRLPSWCDRILFQSYSEPVKVNLYRSVQRSEALQFTDHLPVLLNVVAPHISDANSTGTRSLLSHTNSSQSIGSFSDFIIGHFGWLYASYGPYIVGATILLSLWLIFEIFT
ncbi:LAFE_0E03004g1_1 [Lachancea fermentati]|uniref:LAFE_0E03004g1_1 n=1 Tax=Lachancea fermentati TaxID=4955 RepID=A0A1G4MCG7_LACFM|nr:LAFE_0E03004g1_1 [Lachancea fermentati]